MIPLLLDRGLRVTAVQLPLVSLKDDVATVQRATALEDGPIILVGHSSLGASVEPATMGAEVRPDIQVS
ncbi:MAG: alpha/beta hydrolase family protein [Gammaproteobacteria bacterium]|nr:alpha/beta hydrolase family protein [Gammaproteobacteria bacterium]